MLHTAAYEALGLKWRYEAIDCGVDELLPVLRERRDWAGFSCTMPLKHAVLDIADEVRPIAAAVGAANTLLPRAGGGWIADNTDVAGIVATVREAEVAPGSVTVLGAGGTAQALLGALSELGRPRCTALVRDRSRAARLESTARAMGVELLVAASSPTPQRCAPISSSRRCPAVRQTPLAGAPWHAGQAVLDVVYAAVADGAGHRRRECRRGRY